MIRTPNRRATLRRPVVEGLEDRILLYATTGGHWQHPALVTYSFAPDGTSIGGISSALYSDMASNGISQATWQQQFQKAAAVWEAVANVNLDEVADDGSAYGVAGNQQGDSRFGDIRIGGSPLTGGVLATAFLPPAFNGGTLAG